MQSALEFLKAAAMKVKDLPVGKGPQARKIRERFGAIASGEKPVNSPATRVIAQKHLEAVDKMQAWKEPQKQVFNALSGSSADPEHVMGQVAERHAADRQGARNILAQADEARYKAIGKPIPAGGLARQLKVPTNPIQGPRTSRHAAAAGGVSGMFDKLKAALATPKGGAPGGSASKPQAAPGVKSPGTFGKSMERWKASFERRNPKPDGKWNSSLRKKLFQHANRREESRDRWASSYHDRNYGVGTYTHAKRIVKKAYPTLNVNAYGSPGNVQRVVDHNKNMREQRKPMAEALREDINKRRRAGGVNVFSKVDAARAARFHPTGAPEPAFVQKARGVAQPVVASVKQHIEQAAAGNPARLFDTAKRERIKQHAKGALHEVFGTEQRAAVKNRLADFAKKFKRK
jgi:hypothetical protein